MTRDSVFDNRGEPPMLLGYFNSYESEDENKELVEGIRESFMEIDKYDINGELHKSKQKKTLSLFKKPSKREEGKNLERKMSFKNLISPRGKKQVTFDERKLSNQE